MIPAHLRPHWPAERVYLLYSGAISLLFGLVFTASTVYQGTSAGLNALQNSLHASAALLAPVLLIFHHALSNPKGKTRALG